MGYRSSVTAPFTFALIALAGCSAPTSEEEVDTTEDGLSAGASVEITLMLEEVDDGPSILGVDPAQFEAKTITFFDTRDLALHANGVTLSSTQDDVVATVHPLKEGSVARGYVGDVSCSQAKGVGARAVPRCSFETPTDSFRTGRVLHGVDSPDELFSSTQIGFVEAHAVVPDWSNVKPLGPVHAHRWKIETRAISSGEVTLERWNVPGGERSLEISVRVSGKEAHDAERDLKAWVSSLGLHPASAQGTKTKSALSALTR
jgi:hypothetical protein